MLPDRRPPTSDWCTFVNERMELFLDGELSGSENLAFVTHLKECESCGADWATDERLSLLLLSGLANDVERTAPRTQRGIPSHKRSGATSWTGSLNSTRRLRRASVIAVAVVALICTVGLYTFKRGNSQRDGDRSFDRTSIGSSDETTFLVASLEGRVEVRDGEESEWQALVSGDVVGAGIGVRCASDASLCLEDRNGSALLLGGGSEVSLASGSDTAATLQVHVERGGVVSRMESRSVRLYTADVSVEGSDAIVEVRARDAHGACTVMLSRGRVRAASGMDRRELAAPVAVEVGEGRLFVLNDASRLAPRDVAAIEERDTARRELEFVRAENRRLEKENRELFAQISEVGHLAVMSQSNDSPDTILAEYLEKVDLSNHVDVTEPNSYAINASEELRTFGPAAVTTLSLQLDREPKALRRKAIVGLLGLFGFQERFDPLMRAAFDREEEVRAASLWILDHAQRVELVDHFMAVYRFETVPWLKAKSAYAAARQGCDAAVTALIADYYDSTDSRVRSPIVHVLSRLGSNETVRAFFRRVIVNWTSAEGDMVLRLALKALVDAQDPELPSLLREMLQREGLPTEVRRDLDNSLQRLQNQSRLGGYEEEASPVERRILSCAGALDVTTIELG